MLPSEWMTATTTKKCIQTINPIQYKPWGHICKQERTNFEMSIAYNISLDLAAATIVIIKTMGRIHNNVSQSECGLIITNGMQMKLW